MNDCENIKTLLPQYINGECTEETRIAVEAHLATCPDCQKEFEEMTANIPSLPIKMPEAKQINPMKKIKQHNRKRNIIIITAVSIVIIIAAIIITKYIKFMNGKTVYCESNPVVVLEAILDSFSESDGECNLSIVISENEGHILANHTHSFELYDEKHKVYYQVSDELVGSNQTKCVKIKPTRKKGVPYNTVSLTTAVAAINSALAKEDFDENKIAITLYSLNEVLDSNAIDYAVRYYYDSINGTFAEADDFSALANGHDICFIILQQPLVEVPENGVLMKKEIKVVEIEVLY